MQANKILFAVFVLAAVYIFIGGPDEQPKHQNQPGPIVAEKNSDSGEQTSKGPLNWPPATNEIVQLAENPLADNYLVMLDVSGSMGDAVCDGNETKIKAAKRAVKSFFRQLKPDVNLGLYTFSGDIREILPIGRHDNASFDRSVDVLRAEGGTPLREALVLSEKLLRRAAQSQGGYGSYNLILITDGQSSDGEPGPYAKEIALNTAITINAVGFCTGQRHSLNIVGFTNFATAGNAEQLAESLSRTVQAEQDLFDISDFDPS